MPLLSMRSLHEKSPGQKESEQVGGGTPVARYVEPSSKRRPVLKLGGRERPGTTKPLAFLITQESAKQGPARILLLGCEAADRLATLSYKARGVPKTHD